MKILYINHYAGSPYHGMEFRPYYISKEWIREGHKVLVVASSEAHVRTKKIELTGSFRFEQVNGVDYLWCRTPRYLGNGVKRVLNICSFLLRLLQKTYFFVFNFRPDVVIASSTYTLDIFPSWIIARLSRAKLVYEVHDLWPLSPVELGGMSRWHPFIVAVQLAENFACRFSDSIVSMLPLAREHLISHGMAPSKFHYVPNGISLEEWEQAANKSSPLEIVEEIDRLKTEGFFIVGYLGAHGIANALQNLLYAAEILKNKKIFIYLVGAGPEKQQLIALANSMLLENVKFVNAVKKDQVPMLTRRFDCLYIGLQSQPLFRFGISPNKLMDYMASGRPIVSAVKAGNDPVDEARCGVSVSPEDPNALASAILQLSSLSEARRSVLGANGSSYVRENHDYRFLSKKFLQAIS